MPWLFTEPPGNGGLARSSAGADRLAHDPGLMARWQTAADAGERGHILDGLLPRDVDLPVRNLLYTLADQGDLALLADVVDALRALVERAGEQRLAVEVTSSVPLTEQECQALSQKLEARFGQNLRDALSRRPGDPGRLDRPRRRQADRREPGHPAAKHATGHGGLGARLIR